MKMKASAITAATLLALTAQTVSAAEAVGYNVVTVPANSDVLVSVPFNKDVEATFTVTSVDGTGITVSEALSADTYDSGYYVRFINGSGEGLWSTITDNGNGGLTLADDLSGYVANGDTLRVYEHHTLDSVMASGLVDVAYDTSTSVLLFNNDAEGINKSAVTVATYYDAEVPVPRHGWFDGLTVKGAEILDPGSMFVVRNNGANELTVVTSGDVPDYNNSILIVAGNQADIYLSSGYPVAVNVDALGLEDKGDILLFDNNVSGLNKSASTVATYYDTEVPVPRHGWFDGLTPVGTNSVSSFILRKASSGSLSKVTVNKPY